METWDQSRKKRSMAKYSNPKKEKDINNLQKDKEGISKNSYFNLQCVFYCGISCSIKTSYISKNLKILKTMKKTLFVGAVLFNLSLLSAQTIESGSRSTAGYIKSNGTIENSSHSTVGYITGSGTIENSSHSTIGYIKSDGTIQNKNSSTVGYVKKDGTVENSSHSTIGYIKDNGTVENGSHSTIGYASGIKKEWAAVAFFFFKLN